MNSAGTDGHQPMSMTVSAALAELDDKPASYLATARKLAAADRQALQPMRLTALSTFTWDLIVPYVTVEGAVRGLAIDTVVAPFGQLEQQVLDPTSALYQSEPTAVVIAARVEDIAAELADGFIALTPDAVDAAIDRYVARLGNVVRELRTRSRAHIVVWNQTPLGRLATGLADGGLEHAQQAAIATVNTRLARACSAIPGTSVFDAARVATEVGLDRWFDSKLQYLARCPLGGAAQLAVGKQLARHLRASLVPPCKCLVLDLDNTLWGGVLGEDGASGIALGEDFPGSVFKAFQRQVRSYRDRGVLLAIASKNNEAEILDLFRDHPDLVLRIDDFAARQIHWNDKASSLEAIAKTLDIGIDSLAFFDDNPVERAWVRERLPSVTVIDVPKDPLRYGEALDRSGAFDQLVLTGDDRARAERYQNDVRRDDLERAATSPDEFLRSLQMKVTVGSIGGPTLARTSQLLGKTNQFNVTTRRHTEGELSAMLADPRAVGLWMRVADRFGDNGLVGIAIAVPVDASAHRIDSFLMSCRVLGRRAEYALLDALGERVRRHGATRLFGEFIPTKKNAPAAAFFANAGFASIDERPGWWQLDLASLHRGSDLFELTEES